DWFDSLGQSAVKAAAFDARLHGPAALTGRASRGVTRSLRAHGFDLVAEPESFLVTKQDRLVPGEATRGRDWGTKLGGRILPLNRPIHDAGIAEENGGKIGRLRGIDRF